MTSGYDDYDPYKKNSQHRPDSGLLRIKPRYSTADSDVEAIERPRRPPEFDYHQSFAHRLKRVHKTHGGGGIKCIFASLCLLLYGSAFSVAWIILLTVASILCLYFGQVYPGTCEVMPGLKNLLTMMGGLGLTKSAIGVLEESCRRLGCGSEELEDEEVEGFHRHVCLGFFSKTFALFLCLAFIATSFDVYSTLMYDYQRNEPGLPAYCDNVIGAFAMWLCHSVFILLVLILILLAVLMHFAK